MIRRVLAVLLLVTIAQSALGQAATPQAERQRPRQQQKAARAARQKAKAEQKGPAPTVANYKYADDSERQVLDFWKADTDKPAPVVVMIHGGGWRAGDKSMYRGAVQPFLDKGINVAAVNYRYIPQAMEQHVDPPVKACVNDAARAIQTIRAHAKEWNVDPTRIAATGGSAGACTSLWLAFHKDLANPDSADPVERESTRLTCAAVLNPQTSLDPIEVRKWISNAEYGGHAFGFAGSGRGRPAEFKLLLENREKLMPLIKEYSPIELVTKDAPPIYMHFPNQKQLPKEGQKEPDPTHSAMYGVKLAEKLEKEGVEVVLSYPGHEDTKYGSPEAFMIAKLKGE